MCGFLGFSGYMIILLAAHSVTQDSTSPWSTLNWTGTMDTHTVFQLWRMSSVEQKCLAASFHSKVLKLPHKKSP